MNYYSGGLAELVYSPTRLTYSFFCKWFSGAGSLGRAMNLLGLPYDIRDKSVLVLDGAGRLRVDLKEEERTLYGKTVFSYKEQTDEAREPELTVSLNKIFTSTCWKGTWTILVKQIIWLSRGKETVKDIQNRAENIRDPEPDLSWGEYDRLLGESVWPEVIACGIVCEYYFQVLKKTYRKDDPIWGKIDSRMTENDWFFRSLTDQAEVAGSRMTLTDYLEAYGDRSDSDYELASPRWREIPETVKARIEQYKQPETIRVPGGITNEWVNNYLKLQNCRTELRRKCLKYMYYLRRAIIKATHTDEIGSISADNLIYGKKSPSPKKTLRTVKNLTGDRVSSGTGRPVSKGTVTGKTVHADRTNFSKIDFRGVIGIFPNASTEFTLCYPKCNGILFLAGGQTSHGAIVAREFGIPAVIDHTAQGILEGTVIQLNGATGEWKSILPEGGRI